MVENKSRMLYIQKFLFEQTDEEHPAAVADIMAYLSKEGIPASRQAVARDIELLIEAGADVVCNPGKPIVYFIGERNFELPELKLLVDAVQASRFIPPRKADALIGKLSGFASVYQAAELRRCTYTDKLIRPVSERAYLTVDKLHTAINTDRKITCRYFDWNPDKTREYKHKRKYYQFSPYGLVWNNDRYYAIGWSDSHGKVITLRVDRIAAPKLTIELAVPKPAGFDIAYYAESVFQMYDGPVRAVTLKCENDMMKHVIDRFGENVKTVILDPEHFAAYVSVPASPTFFAWVFTFCGGIRIEAPEDILLDLIKTAKTFAEK